MKYNRGFTLLLIILYLNVHVDKEIALIREINASYEAVFEEENTGKSKSIEGKWKGRTIIGQKIDTLEHWAL